MRKDPRRQKVIKRRMLGFGKKAKGSRPLRVAGRLAGDLVQDLQVVNYAGCAYNANE